MVTLAQSLKQLRFFVHHVSAFITTILHELALHGKLISSPDFQDTK